MVIGRHLHAPGLDRGEGRVPNRDHSWPVLLGVSLNRLAVAALLARSWSHGDRDQVKSGLPNPAMPRAVGEMVQGISTEKPLDGLKPWVLSPTNLLPCRESLRMPATGLKSSSLMLTQSTLGSSVDS